MPPGFQYQAPGSHFWEGRRENLMSERYFLLLKRVSRVLMVFSKAVEPSGDLPKENLDWTKNPSIKTVSLKIEWASLLVIKISLERSSEKESS